MRMPMVKIKAINDIGKAVIFKEKFANFCKNTTALFNLFKHKLKIVNYSFYRYK